MNYNIHITRQAERDMDNAANYIKSTLMNPSAAYHLLESISTGIASLRSLPQRNKPIDDPLIEALDIRFIQIDNYLAFYVISESNKTVYIIRFLYAKRNWLSILKQGFTLY